MTECARFRDALLTAEPGELEGRGASPLARHVRKCVGCGESAARFMEANRLLGRRLSARPEIDAAAVVERALGSGRASGAAERAGPVGGASARTRRWWPALALAASVAALVLLYGEDRAPLVSLPAPPLPRPATVEPEQGSNVAVLPTENPDITVLWFF